MRFVLGLLAIGAWAHGVHASLTSIDFNSQTNALEITIVMTADDLEMLLRRETGRQIELDRTPGAEKLVYEYVKKSLALRTRGGEAVALDWVGMEVRTAKLTVFMEAKALKSPAGMTIRNELLFDMLPDQVNMLAVKRDHKGKSSDHLFQVGGSWQTVRLE